MKIINLKSYYTIFILTVMFALLSSAGELLYSYAGVKEKNKNLISEYVNQKGEIELPSDFRKKWTHLGSWSVPDKQAPGYGFHDVYTQNGITENFRKTGKFPEGTILIKEIREVVTKPLTTGREVHWAGKPIMWFVMVKDPGNSFPGNPNWGDGWGWTLYNAEDPAKNISTDYKKDCLGCHIPAKNTDWVFIQGYPDLREVKE